MKELFLAVAMSNECSLLRKVVVPTTPMKTKQESSSSSMMDIPRCCPRIIPTVLSMQCQQSIPGVILQRLPTILVRWRRLSFHIRKVPPIHITSTIVVRKSNILAYLNHSRRLPLFPLPAISFLPAIISRHFGPVSVSLCLCAAHVHRPSP